MTTWSNDTRAWKRKVVLGRTRSSFPATQSPATCRWVRSPVISVIIIVKRWSLSAVWLVDFYLQWSAWSNCSATCGRGMRMRHTRWIRTWLWCRGRHCYHTHDQTETETEAQNKYIWSPKRVTPSPGVARLPNWLYCRCAKERKGELFECEGDQYFTHTGNREMLYQLIFIIYVFILIGISIECLTSENCNSWRIETCPSPCEG